MKKNRHSEILSIISQYTVSTQEELLEKLKERGCSTTQATVSRDIKELNLIKQMNKQGGAMTVKNVSPEIMEIFEVTGFSDILTIE